MRTRYVFARAVMRCYKEGSIQMDEAISVLIWLYNSIRERSKNIMDGDDICEMIGVITKLSLQREYRAKCIYKVLREGDVLDYQGRLFDVRTKTEGVIVIGKYKSAERFIPITKDEFITGGFLLHFED